MPTPPPDVEQQGQREQGTTTQREPWPSAPFPALDPDRYAAIVRTAFSKRRKTLRNALRGLLEADEIAAAGCDPGARPETLAPADFARLSVVSTGR